MRRILIIGIGAGNPDYLTIQAIDALNAVDVFFLFDKGRDKSDLVRLRTDICERHATRRPHRFVTVRSPEWSPRGGADYGAIVAGLNRRKEALSGALIARELRDGECGGLLVWGDPALYDSTIRILERLAARGDPPVAYEVVPGISSVQALAARHRIPLNSIGGEVRITTGRRLAAGGFPADADSVVVMLDGEGAFATLPDEDLDIYYGAYLGTPDETLIRGRLQDVAAEIGTFRSEARARKGWLMDSYLLRRAPRGEPSPQDAPADRD